MALSVNGTASLNFYRNIELERSDNEPWHLRYGSGTKQMGQYLLKVLQLESLKRTSVSALRLGALVTLPQLGIRKSSVCLWTGVFQKPVLWVVFWMNFHKAAKKSPAVRWAEYQVLVATHRGTTAPQQNSCKNIFKMPNPATFPLALFSKMILSETLHSEAHNSFGDFSPRNESWAQLMASDIWIPEGKCWTPVATLSFSLKSYPVSPFLFSCIKPQTIIFFSVALGPAYNTKSI